MKILRPAKIKVYRIFILLLINAIYNYFTFSIDNMTTSIYNII